MEITADHDHDRYIATQEFNKLTTENAIARLPQANLENKNDIATLVKKMLLQIKLNMFLLKMNQMNYQKKLKQNQQTE